MAAPFRNQPVDLTAPTPQNTPANNAPISSRAQQPGVASISELDERDAKMLGALAKDPAMVALMQHKLNGLIGKSSGYIESLPKDVKRRITGLKGIQAEHSKLEAQLQEEVLELEKKYFKKFTPLYENRAKIINGEVEPTEDQVTLGEQLEAEMEDDEDEEKEEKEEKPEAEEQEKDAEPMKGIPQFWSTAMKNHPSLAEIITPEDDDALASLVDIRMEYLDKPGFKLIFEFAPNDFFTNKLLTKSYFYREENGYGGDFIYDHAEGTDIDWKPNKNLTVTIETKKQRNKNTKQTRLIKKTIPTDSFFNFFKPPVPPADGEEPEDEDIEERLELDYQIGEDIKEKLIPHGVGWFTGEALQFEGYDELDEEDLEEFDDDEDDDEDGDDDDEEDSDEDADGSKPKPDTTECKQS